MRTAYRKVIRDLWGSKGRTLMVVLSIAVGVMALGMILSSNSLMFREMTTAQQASNPSHGWLFLNGLIDDETVRSVARIPEVQDAQGRAERGIRWKPSLDAEWQDATLITVEEFEDQKFDLIELREGNWPDSDSVVVEFNHIDPFKIASLGGEVYFEVNQRARPLIVGGIVRDPSQAAPPFTTEPAFYVTRQTMEELIGTSEFDQVRITIPLEYSDEEVERVADIVTNKLERQDVGVEFVFTNNPERHWAQDIMDGIGLVLSIMAIASLFLSVILVINTINAVITQQLPQIGIMKTVGGASRQISQIYYAGVVVYSVLALAIAVPLGAIAGNALASWLLSILNVPVPGFEFHGSTLLVQFAAGLLVPILAALYPVFRGVTISVVDALGSYGLGSGRYGTSRIDRIVGGIQGLPRMLTLSLRNTFRRTGRVALTQIVLITAGTIFIMVISTQYSFTETIADIWRGLGVDVFVIFEDNQRIDEVEPLIATQPNVDHVEMWIWHTANAKVPGDDSTEERLSLRGIPRDTQLYSPKLTAGRGLLPDDGHALLLNQKLASDMELSIGDQIEIELAGEASLWTVVGLIFDITNDQSTAYMHIDTLSKEINQVGRAAVAEIKARDDSPDDQVALAENLEAFLEERGIGVGFIQSAAENQAQAEAQFSILTTILMTMTVVMAVVGSIGLSGTLSINVLERRREIGVMRAVGASSVDVALIFMGEGLLLGIASWMIAVPLGIIAGKPFVDAIGGIIEFPSTYQLAFHGIWIWLGIIIVLSLLASWLPARRATQISVSESLAYE